MTFHLCNGPLLLLLALFLFSRLSSSQTFLSSWAESQPSVWNTSASREASDTVNKPPPESFAWLTYICCCFNYVSSATLMK